jgi:hypothetical protein
VFKISPVRPSVCACARALFGWLSCWCVYNCCLIGCLTVRQHFVIINNTVTCVWSYMPHLQYGVRQPAIRLCPPAYLPDLNVMKFDIVQTRKQHSLWVGAYFYGVHAEGQWSVMCFWTPCLCPDREAYHSRVAWWRIRSLRRAVRRSLNAQFVCKWGKGGGIQ